MVNDTCIWDGEESSAGVVEDSCATVLNPEGSGVIIGETGV